MLRLLLATVLSLTAVSPILGQEPDAKYPRVVTGKITDAADKPVAGARIEYGYFTSDENERETALTDSDGTYRLEIRKAGRDYRIGVSANGFAPQYVDRFIPGPAEKPSVYSAKLQPAAQLSLRLVTRNGMPAKNVHVRPMTPQSGHAFSRFSSPVGPTPLPGHDRRLKTDDNGRVALSNLPAMPPSPYLQKKVPKDKQRPTPWLGLQVASNGATSEYPVTIEDVAKTKQDEPTTIVVSDSHSDETARNGVLQCRVVDKSTGEPIQDFIVVRRYSTEAEPFSSLDGRFTSGGNLRPGRKYQTRIYKSGYAVAVGSPVSNPKEDVEEYLFELERHPSLRGRVVDTDGKPVANIELLTGHSGKSGFRYIEWSTLDSYADGHHSLENVLRVKTNENGEFVVPEAPNHATTLITRVPGFARMVLPPEQRPQAGPDGIVTITLKRAASLIVMADRTTPLGRLADSVGLSIRSEDGFQHMFHSSPLDENGQKVFDSMTPGSYSISLYSHSGNSSYPCYTKQVTLGAGEEAPVELGEMTGTITLTGKAPPFSTVRINATGIVEGSRYFAVHVDIDGEFQLQGLQPGGYSIAVDNTSASSGYHGSGRARNVEIKKDMQLDLIQPAIQGR